QAHRAVDRGLLALAAQGAGARVDLLERRRQLVELAGVGRAEQRVVDRRHFLDAAHGALQHEAFALEEAAGPAALRLLRQRIEAPGDVFGRLPTLFGVAENRLAKHAGDRRLLDGLAVVAAVQPVQDVAYHPGILDQFEQVGAGAFLAGAKPQNRL